MEWTTPRWSQCGALRYQPSVPISGSASGGTMEIELRFKPEYQGSKAGRSAAGAPAAPGGT